jgi:hypothetical protein
MQNQKTTALVEKIRARLGHNDLNALPALEFDLLMQHLRELYEELENLKRAPRVHEVKAEKPVIAAPVEEKPIVTEQSSVIPQVEKPVEQKPVVNKVAQPVITPVAEKEKKISPVTVNERVETVTSLNEKLKGSAVTEVHRRLSSKPLRDLIDLNKKHVLVNELFAGDTQKYSHAIEEIDAFIDYDTAHAYLRSHLITAHNWDEGSQTVRMFAKLVKQKFAIE